MTRAIGVIAVIAGVLLIAIEVLPMGVTSQASGLGVVRGDLVADAMAGGGALLFVTGLLLATRRRAKRQVRAVVSALPMDAIVMKRPLDPLPALPPTPADEYPSASIAVFQSGNEVR